METMTITREETLKIFRCIQCDLPIALSEATERAIRKYGDTFYCPRQHGQWFGKGEAETLREKLDAANARAARMEREKHEALIAAQNANEAAATAKAAHASLKKRASAGVCPCCKRTFSALGAALTRHIKTKHPEYLGK